jgi:hypothetical protein
MKCDVCIRHRRRRLESNIPICTSRMYLSSFACHAAMNFLDVSYNVRLSKMTQSLVTQELVF